MEQADLVELVLVDGVVDDGVGGGFLRGDEALGGDHGDVPLLGPSLRERSGPGGGGGEEVWQPGRGAVASGAERVGRRRKEMEREETDMWGPLTAH